MWPHKQIGQDMKTSVADIIRQIKEQQEEKADLRQYQDVFSRAAEGINATYYPQAYGFIGWLHDKQPLLYTGIKKLEDRMATPLLDGTTLSDFTALVEEWEALHTQGIELFLKEKE